jgi:hypothetical protein
MHDDLSLKFNASANKLCYSPMTVASISVGISWLPFNMIAIALS